MTFIDVICSSWLDEVRLYSKLSKYIQPISPNQIDSPQLTLLYAPTSKCIVLLNCILKTALIWYMYKCKKNKKQCIDILLIICMTVTLWTHAKTYINHIYITLAPCFKTGALFSKSRGYSLSLPYTNMQKHFTHYTKTLSLKMSTQ